MSEYVTLNPPSDEDREPWTRQMALLAEHVPGALVDPRFPHLGTDPRPWGIPKRLMPPVDCVDFVSAIFKSEVAECSQTAFLRPEVKFSIVTLCAAHFLWLATKSGAEWLLEFFGIEEIEPHPGYIYYYQPKADQPQYFELSERTGMRLRIFQRCERNMEPPIPNANSPVIAQMKSLLEKARAPEPYVPKEEPFKHGATGMYYWVSGQIRNWFLEPTPNRDWPTKKPDRISGPQWAKSVKRDEINLRYAALEKIDQLGSRAYRIEDANGGVIWSGAANISHPPVTDMMRQLKEPEHKIDDLFRCSSCGHIRCCVTMTGTSGRMCRHCIGAFLEKDERPTLHFCTYRECKACPDHLKDSQELINLTTKLNRELDFPVHR
jgi:hypothetical protein